MTNIHTQKIERERTDDKSVFSFNRMLFRYRYALKFFKPGSVLDIGCGYAYGADFFRDFRYTGIDYFDEAVATASRLHPEATFRAMKVPPLAFPDSSFTNIVCAEMIEHVETQEAIPLLKECYRVLEPGGILFLSTPNGENRLQKSPDHFIEYTTGQMEGMIRKTDFKILHRGGLSLDIVPNRYANTRSHRIRGRLYRMATGGTVPNESMPKQNPGSNGGLMAGIRRLLKGPLRLSLVLAAKGIIYAGYAFPSKAEYQIWVCVK